MKRSAFRTSLLLGTLVAASAASGSEFTKTAVFAWADKSYQREMQPNGRPVRQYYALSNGGVMPGTIRDLSVAQVEFPEVAGVLAEHLGRQNYFLAPDAKSADLLLIVHWGTTAPFADTNERLAIDRFGDALSAVSRSEDAAKAAFSSSRNEPASGLAVGTDDALAQQTDASSQTEAALAELNMYQSMRHRALLPTAQLLGYVNAVDEANDIRRYFTTSTFNELMEEVSDPRYYVVVSAYDFRRTVEQKEPKLLWQTRLSIGARGARFGDNLNELIASGTRYFGRDSKKQLIRTNLRDVRVEIGEATVVSMNDAPSSQRKR